MALIDERTAQLHLPLPHASNPLEADVTRLRQALEALDAALAERPALSSVETLIAQSEGDLKARVSAIELVLQIARDAARTADQDAHDASVAMTAAQAAQAAAEIAGSLAQAHYEAIPDYVISMATNMINTQAIFVGQHAFA